MPKRDFSIIVPYFNRWDLTHETLMQLYKFAPDCEVVLVNDDSTDADCVQGVGWWLSNGVLNIEYIQNYENQGFLKSMNIGVRAASGSIVALLSNDVQVRGDFVSPVENLIGEDPKTLIGGRILGHDTGWNSFDVGDKELIVPYCEGWFLALSKAAWDELGGFDEIYAPNDFEDVDLSFNALYNRYRLAYLDPVLLSHEHLGTTVNAVQGVANRAEITKQNREKFIRKWEQELFEFSSLKLGYQFVEG